MTFVLTAIKIVFLLSFLILIHEAGHFFVAKACKVKVNEFAIGFGPTILKKQGKTTLYALRLIPLGGFVNLEGEEEDSDQEGSFSKTSVPRRIAIVAAGGLTNIIFGLLSFFILSIIFYLSEKPEANFLASILYGLENTGTYVGLVFEGLGKLFTGSIGINQLTGPIGISGMVAKTSGLFDFVNLLSVISLSLGITNLLPLLPLDGGKIVIYIIEAIRKKPMKKNIEIWLQTAGFTAMIILSIFVAYNDVVRFF